MIIKSLLPECEYTPAVLRTLEYFDEKEKNE